MVTPRDRVNPVTELDGEWNNFAVDATRQTNFHQAQPSAFVNHATYACPSVSLLPPANTLFLRTRCSCVTRHPSAACAGTLISSSVVCYMIATSSFQRPEISSNLSKLGKKDTRRTILLIGDQWATVGLGIYVNECGFTVHRSCHSWNSFIKNYFQSLSFDLITELPEN